ncbi:MULTISPECIES: VOC family protein [Gordonia]|jgi:predicted enzyme related to lactoylglutathione lyase|uniref:VOC domain-containing protein n=1 Tax=Gordonia alkanivorans NBRC 16433 TaxID=1027371 RepID=F9VPL4_9ACTN|nr:MULTISPECIES: VOC family protein [Gordonia]MDH3008436.1 VOC family protein [Gordonia alkanivorans]MDH3015634.1 VOC family protein [Gordonia alkanivorans]MDH3020368.1 VOC family protein [Gordonia alkanivorans]MDH3026650.1 VOC family protein [Gordonia alkanivorans]MDH3040218.1 VOC family protein [Gordonia alkanivorans]
MEAEEFMAAALSKPVVDLGIVTMNIDEMTCFYRDVLGLPELDRIRMGGVSITRFQLGDALLKMLVYDTAPASTAAVGGIGASTGIRYLTISVDDLAELLADCRESGIASVLKEPFEVESGTWIAFVTDPDGNTIEFVQRDDAA